MASEIKVARPGVVDRQRVARTPKHCALCGQQINPGEEYWARKRSWQRFSVPICEGCS